MATFRIRELAQAQGLSQEALAIKSRVRVRTVQRLWQDTIEKPYAETLIRLADALGVSVQELYTTEGLKATLEDIQMPGLVALPA
jgi:transcriptional regulator with XRE-family HTH domain